MQWRRRRTLAGGGGGRSMRTSTWGDTHAPPPFFVGACAVSAVALVGLAPRVLGFG